MEGIYLIDKPSGITSFDVIRQLRTRLGIRKMGHAGTLDPLASGLMIIGVGSGTKALTEYIKLPKTYEARIRLGIRTDTGDTEGEVVASAEVGEVSDEKIIEVLKSMEGEVVLPVPAYSAIKQGGVPLYKKARAGEKVEVPERRMRIEEAVYQGREENDLHVVFSVGSGAYIRSLAEELGARLGYPATLAGLRRTRIGDFSIENAQLIDEVYI